jgi:hypothetical protein
MADRVLFISWGENVAGREERGLEVFDEAVGFYGRAQSEGRIESFDVALLAPSGDIDGYMVIKGSAEQINALTEDAEYLRIMTEASTVVHRLRTVPGYSGAEIARMMEVYKAAIEKAPQMA